MTSFRQPDYDLGLCMSLINFRTIAGTAFDVSTTYGEDQQRFSGMLIVPQGNEFPETSSNADAWLWSEDHTDVPAGTKVAITLGGPCDPMLIPEEKAALATQRGLILEGVITRNWNTGQGTVPDT